MTSSRAAGPHSNQGARAATMAEAFPAANIPKCLLAERAAAGSRGSPDGIIKAFRNNRVHVRMLQALHQALHQPLRPAAQAVSQKCHVRLGSQRGPHVII